MMGERCGPKRSEGDQDARTAAFVAAAEEVTALAEGRAQRLGLAAGQPIPLGDLQAALCRLHLAFLDLPEAREAEHEPPRGDSYGASKVVFDAWSATSQRLADALAGVYRDLEDGLELHHRSAPGDRRTALWAWESLFWQHWGEELLKAQLALHRLMARERFDRELAGE